MFRKNKVSIAVGDEDSCVEMAPNGIRFNGSTMTAEPISKDRMKVVINGRRIKFDRDEFLMMFLFFEQMKKAMDEEVNGPVRMYN